MSSFLAERGDHNAANMYRIRSKQCEVEADIGECDEEDDCDNVSDELDTKSPGAILSECMEMARLRNSDREIEKDRDKEKNAHGETRLHIAARSTDTVLVEKLITARYDVNKRDHGGWTPISEAVSAGIRENVRILLKAGAEVDPVSTEVLNDDENSTGGGITPLMEACDKGFVEIARDLLKCGASVVKKNADGWTAVDFLRNFLASCGDEDEEHVKELTTLVQFMEDEQRKHAFPVRGYVPQRLKSKKTRSLISASQTKRHELEENVDLNGYKRIIEGLGAQSRKKEKHVFSDEKKALSLDDDVMVLESPTRSEIALPCDFEEQRNVGSCSTKNESRHRGLSPELPLLPTFTAKRDKGIFLPCEIPNDFVFADESRRRKRGYQDEEDFAIEVKKPSQEIRSNADSFSRSGAQRCSADAIEIPNTLSNGEEPHIVATLRFEDEHGGMLRADKVVSFPRTATMAIAHDRICSELAAYESNSFDIRLSDGREADANVPLSSLGEPLVIICRLSKPTAEVLFKSRAGEREAVSNYISKFDSTGVLDLSSASPSDHTLVEDVLKALADTKRVINRLVLDGCDITSGALSAVNVVLPNVEEFSCKYVGLYDEHLTILCSVSSYPSVSSVDLSHNELTSGFVLSKFIAACTNLKELRICDLDLALGEEAAITSLCGLNNLALLDLSFSGFVRGHLVEQLFSSCNSLINLKLDGCDLSGVSFMSTWLPNLRELSMVSCQFTEFDSLIEWISMGCVQLLDLSATDITIDHLRTLVDARVMCSPMVVRLVRCRNVESNAQIFADVIPHFNDHQSFPLKFVFSPSFANELHAITASVSNFLGI
ncbi:hypothetical protein KIN20_002314 [Parelaphostrongylus tenuis]|uniref:Uncharacterized protein n=1 Tax=Parelaphostrongylus tenuis TaxID=148309 RepID=A0AAD5QF76_PARTN|nr:hypothetical protein KIN20_002314 [Parelaphostrongylus tenuis]